MSPHSVVILHEHLLFMKSNNGVSIIHLEIQLSFLTVTVIQLLYYVYLCIMIMYIYYVCHIFRAISGWKNWIVLLEESLLFVPELLVKSFIIIKLPFLISFVISIMTPISSAVKVSCLKFAWPSIFFLNAMMHCSLAQTFRHSYT